MSERRGRLLVGEAGHLLPRDQGPVRRYVSCIVDSLRRLLGRLMALTGFLMLFLICVPQLQHDIPPLMR
ncbi:DUF3043 domain-containing protein, partial [Mycobacterium avium]|uniref:DUF3043 domain-containing protein n=1 Tax=Mycobacterium avium TaxID=1764 RepID=UPI003AFA40DB